MNNLSAFFSQNATKVENIKYIVSERFLAEEGDKKAKKPIEWEIQCITSSEDEELRKQCVKRVPVPGKKGLSIAETDYSAYSCKLAVRCTVFPNLNDAELQNSYGVLGAEALLKTMLTPGEYTDYISKVQEVNGFDITFEDKVEEAKN